MDLARKDVSQADLDLVNNLKEQLKDVSAIKGIIIVGSCMSGTALVITSDLNVWILLKEEYPEEEIIKKLEGIFLMDMKIKENRVLVQLRRLEGDFDS